MVITSPITSPVLNYTVNTVVTGLTFTVAKAILGELRLLLLCIYSRVLITVKWLTFS